MPGGVLFTSGELAARLKGELRGPPSIEIRGLETLEAATSSQLSFVREAKYWPAWSASKCGAALVSQRAAAAAAPQPGERALIIVPDADAAMIQILSSLAPPARYEPRRHESAVVDPTAIISQGVHIGPGAVIGPRAFIGEAATILANAVIGADAVVGRQSVVHAGVVIHDRCVIGAHVVLHAGVVIGADGFGYFPDPRTRMPMKIPHIGTVVIEDHVEIGANTAIDRGKFGATRIGEGTKIDNIVQIGHNCRIGKGCIICGMCGLAGSVVLADNVTLAGGVAIADNRFIGAGATTGARSGVMDDVPPGETWLGYPARPARETMRLISALDRLPELTVDMRRLLKPRQGPDTEQTSN